MSNLAKIFGDYSNVKIRWNGDPDNPIWVAADVGKALGLTNVHKTLLNFKDYQKGVVYGVETPGGKQDMTGVTVQGLNRLLFKSTRDEAEAFQDWVFDEVLPSIEAKGYYIPDPDKQISESVYTKRLKYGMRNHIVPPGYWTIFHQVSELMGILEDNLDIGKMDLIDGSVGKCWSHYRKEQMKNGAEWIRESTTYTHVFPDHRGDIEDVNAYDMNELQHFWHWFITLYIPVKLKAYLKKKYGKDQTEKALNSVKDKYLPELPPGAKNLKSKKKK